MSFNSCIHLCNPFLILIQYAAITPKISPTSHPSQSPPAPTSTGNHCPDFFCHWLVLAISELHMNGTIQDVPFCIWLLSLSIMILRPMHVLCISEAVFCWVILLIHSPADGVVSSLLLFYLLRPRLGKEKRTS